MKDNTNVFTSDIIRVNNKLNNNLYDLLRIVPAKPLPVNIVNTCACDFVPKTDKYYVPKKKSKLKVKTVRNVREIFEKDVFSELYLELEKHRNALLRKIRVGSSREEATSKMAKNIFRSETPISKDVWQMITNLNPEGHAHSAQFVLWNRKSIRINGSKGGKNKFICNFDIGLDNIRSKNTSIVKSTRIHHRKKMLNSSLNVKFKSGPLSKKKQLDCSYQKFQYGYSTIVSLPKPGLDIQPVYGVTLGQTMTNFLTENFMRDPNGKLTKKWADFSLSVLGVNKSGCPIQAKKDTCVSFDLLYKCNQNRILMRNAAHHCDPNPREIGKTRFFNKEPDLTTINEVNVVVNKILDYVEIKLELDNQCNEDDNDAKELSRNDRFKKTNVTLKEKCKKKFGELDRLDVRVIKLSSTDSYNTKCKRDHCSLGCICGSLECSYILKTHCGRVECMFECKCFNIGQWSTDSPDSTFYLSGLDHLNKKLNAGLAKEEQKFRQTVVLSGEKSILLKSQKRDWKSSKKYADFYSNMCLKTETKTKKILYVITPKLHLDNVEPWCMVHNLYKCFCKCKFTERALPKCLEENDVPEKLLDTSVELVSDEILKDPFKSKLRLRSHKQVDVSVTTEQENIQLPITTENQKCESKRNKCVRVKPFKGRKYTDDYYLKTNKKIIEMEKNDDTLQKKMTCLMNSSDEKYYPTNIVISPKDNPKRLNIKRKLVAWLEASYKQYKECKDRGMIISSLEPPSDSKLAFYSWEFILSRYRERKNLFLVTPERPYRIFMAVNVDHPKLKKCINIKDLILHEDQEYSATIKNLLFNATDLKDNFCILRGLSYCWEVVGTVTKVNEVKGGGNIYTFDRDNKSSPFDKECISDDSTSSNKEPQGDNVSENVHIDIENIPEKIQQDKSDISEKISDLSKWFVMFIENDFNEIHFYAKGFFVKYDSIVKAINVSRVSSKTVRLSSQKCSKGQNKTQFGIYAVPNKKKLNVFVGPYEQDEPLGIDTVKSILSGDNTKHTIGMWIVVNKDDNVKIIDQPLTFLPSATLCEKMIPLETEISRSKEANNCQFNNLGAVNVSMPETPKKEPRVSKTVKPIKIRKSNGFYQLQSKEIKSLFSKFSNSSNKNPKNTFIEALGKNELKKKTAKSIEPIPENIPQNKIIEHTQIEKVIPYTINRPGMCILKPEEINKKSLEQKTVIDIKCELIEKDIEDFLATSRVCKLPKEDVYVISDDELDKPDPVKDVWIQSKNVKNLGWIPAKRNSNNHISFEFPGFKYTNFYPKEEAFSKINLVFSRKVYVPKVLEMEWEIVENVNDLKATKILLANDLRPDLTMTKRGLIPKVELMDMLKVKRKSLDMENTHGDAKRLKLLMELEDYTGSSLDNETF